MTTDPLTAGRLSGAAGRASVPPQTGRLDKDKLSWRLSLLVILVLSLALWAGIWVGVEALLHSRW